MFLMRRCIKVLKQKSKTNGDVHIVGCSESVRREREESMSQVETILEIKDLCVEFKTVEGTVQAVDHLSYTLHKGEKLGIVGESGSGKSVSSLGMMQLIPNPPGKITDG